MLETFRNAWKIEDLRKRILYTLAIIVIFRAGCAIPVPYIDPSVLSGAFGSADMLSYLNMLSGGALSQCAIFALGVSPYINASIIIQLLTVAIPQLEALAREGEEGRRKLTKITQYTAGGIALAMSIGYYFVLRNSAALEYTTGAEGWFSAFVIILAFTAGAMLITWCGSQIDEKGVGNGISLLIFAGIVSRWDSVYNTVVGMLAKASGGEPQYYIFLPLLLVLALAVVLFIVVLTNAERRIPVQYAKKVVGRKMYGGQSSHIPLKVNMTGVMPIIFAQAIASLPATIAAFAGVSKNDPGFWGGFLRVFDTTSIFYIVVYFLLIVGFSFFYSTMQFNPVEVANNLKKNGGFIPGFRPGKPTADFIHKVLNKITMFGALYLAIIAIAPIVTGAVIGVSSLAIGGTSIIIVVGVALETTKALEAQMLMRHYKGFLE